MLKYFHNPFFYININLPIIIHSNEAKQECALIMRAANGIPQIQEKIDSNFIKYIICKKEYFSLFKNVNFIECNDVDSAIAFLCKQNFPNACNNIIGITGTNGKTSITYFIAQILKKLNQPTLLINSNGIFINDELIEKTPNSTPSAYIIHKHLNEFTKKIGQNAFCIIETTSIAIDQKRIAEIEFSFACFSNFSQDHLDYHKTMQEYFAQKMKLGKYSKKFIVHNSIEQNEYEKFGTELIECIQNESLNITYKFDNQIFTISNNNIIGEFQAINLLCAILVLKHFFPIQDFISEINHIHAPKGRMERIGNFIVDNSHTPDAIKNALNTLRKITKGKLFIIAGAGGNRDTSKRILIGNEMAQADFAIITTDNPRNEDPLIIAQAIALGCKNNKIILNRQEAIEFIFNIMEKDDICLVAGKGCEEFQEFANIEKIPFSDAAIIRKLYSQKN